jgi:hypothetical protein
MSVLVAHPIANKDVNISSAEAYGELKIVNGRYIFIDEVEEEQLPPAFASKMLRAVDEFDPEADYLLIAGDHLQLVALSAMLADRWGRFRVLRYDREARGYAPVEIVVGE